MKSFEPISRKLKALLKTYQNSPRNYASVLAVWNSQAPAWTWTNGYTIMGQGEIGTEPEHLITLKDLEYKIIDGSLPFVPSDQARRPMVRYPSCKGIIDTDAPKAKVRLNADYLAEAIKHIKGLESKEAYVDITITENQVKLESRKTWAVLCTIA